MVVALRRQCTIIVWAGARSPPVRLLVTADDDDVGCSMLLSRFFVSRLSLGRFLRCILDTTTIAAITKQLHKNAGGTPTNLQKRVPLLRQASRRSLHIPSGPLILQRGQSTAVQGREGIKSPSSTHPLH